MTPSSPLRCRGLSNFSELKLKLNAVGVVDLVQFGSVGNRVRRVINLTTNRHPYLFPFANQVGVLKEPRMGSERTEVRWISYSLRRLGTACISNVNDFRSASKPTLDPL